MTCVSNANPSQFSVVPKTDLQTLESPVATIFRHKKSFNLIIGYEANHLPRRGIVAKTSKVKSANLLRNLRFSQSNADTLASGSNGAPAIIQLCVTNDGVVEGVPADGDQPAAKEWCCQF